MIIIPREELNKASLGLSTPREGLRAFDKWLAVASGKSADSAPTSVQTARPQLYSHRQWRCE